MSLRESGGPSPASAYIAPTRTRGWVTWRAYWPAGVVVAATLILFAPFVLGQARLYWGTPLLQFQPWREFGFNEMLAGRAPLWNPLVGAGAPLLANYQSGLLYPPNWLGVLLPLDLAHNWLLVGHVALTGVGMVALVRRLGYPALGQVVAGLAFGLSQYVVARASFYSINTVVAWTPWLVWAADRALLAGGGRERVRAALILAGLAALQLLAGHAQTTWYTWLLIAAWVAWRLWTAPVGRRRARWVGVLVVGVAGAWAAAIAAAQLLPTAELLRQSQRAESAEIGFVMTYSLAPLRLLTLLAPDLFGTPAGREYFGYGMYLEDAIYAGVIPLLLALGMLLRWLGRSIARLVRRARPRDGERLEPDLGAPLGLAVGCVALGVVLGLGANTPVFPWLYAHVPTFNMFQAPTRMMVWFEFGVALLAGWGVGRWRTVAGRALYWTRLGTAAAAGLALVAWALAFSLNPATHALALMRWMALGAVPAGVNLAIFGALTLLAPGLAGEKTQPAVWRRRRAWAWPTLVVLALAGDLIVANQGINPAAAADLYARPGAADAAVRSAAGAGRIFSFPDDEHTIKFEPYFDFASYGEPAVMAQGARNVLTPDTGMLAGIASFNNFDPLLSGRWLAYTDVLSETRSLPLLRLAEVRVLSAPTTTGPQGLDWSSWPVVAEVDAVQFRRLPGEGARTRVVYSSIAVEDSIQAAFELAAPGFDPDRTVIVEPASDPTGASLPATADGPTQTTTTVSLERDGWVVLSDAAYPGWIAFVDGAPAPVYPADLAFRAVRVPAGTHTVVWKYESSSWRIGLVVSGVGFTVWITLALGLSLASAGRFRRTPSLAT